MNRRPFSRPALLALACAFAFLVEASPQLDSQQLVRISRVQSTTVSAAEALAGVSGLLELQTGWLAEASGDALARLRALGIAFDVLDASPGGKRYFLVFAHEGGTLDDLQPLGAVIEVEPGVCLVSAQDESLRERLPARFSLARLTLSPPALVEPSFDRAERAQAVPRARAAIEFVDARIAQAVSQVSANRLSLTIRALESYQSRYASTTNVTAAGNYLYDQFRQLGLDVEFDDFTFAAQGYLASNIVATIPGRVSPGDIVVLCAHYDSYSDQRPAVAPGADDNASGTAALLEAARVLAATSFDFTIKLIAFSAEEWGLYGSKHYAQAARGRGDRILAVVNLDMIGFADQVPEDLDVVANPASEWLADRLTAAAAVYAPLPVLKQVNASLRSSDHAPFWDQGYHAVLCIEDLPLHNPYYHKVTDRFDTLNMAFAETASRAAIATVADLAQPIGAIAGPTGLVVRAEDVRSLFVRARRSVLEWTASAGAAGYNVYRSATSHGAYRRLNASPVTATSFADGFVSPTLSSYYVVAAVDSAGRESNYSAEAAGQ